MCSCRWIFLHMYSVTVNIKHTWHSIALHCTQGGWLDTLDIDILFTIHIDIFAMQSKARLGKAQLGPVKLSKAQAQ